MVREGFWVKNLVYVFSKIKRHNYFSERAVPRREKKQKKYNSKATEKIKISHKSNNSRYLLVFDLV